MTRFPVLAVVAASALLAGCELLGIESPEKIAAARDADGRAIGGACRHAGRAIEDCYQLNKKADRAAIFAGWREMNDYMRENQLESVPPTVAEPAGAGKSADAGDKGEKGEKGEKGAGKGGEKGDKADKAEKSAGKSAEGKAS